MAVTNEALAAKLDEILALAKKTDASIEKIQGIAAEALEKATPILKRLEDSPVIKMLGGLR